MPERGAPVRHPAEQGLISTLLGKLSQILVLLALSLLFSICAEWIGMAFFWPEQGRQHSEAMLAAELGYLEQRVKVPSQMMILDLPFQLMMQELMKVVLMIQQEMQMTLSLPLAI